MPLANRRLWDIELGKPPQQLSTLEATSLEGARAAESSTYFGGMMKEIHSMQALVDGMSAAWQKDRAGSQMTLGALINALEALQPDTPVSELVRPHSYRGYYCDLAFEQTGGPSCAGALLTICKSAMGQVFEGYKGGDYMMGANTPIWIANYGDCGVKIISLRPDGTFEMAED